MNEGRREASELAFNNGVKVGIENGKKIGHDIGYKIGYNDKKITTEYCRLNYKGPFEFKSDNYLFTGDDFIIGDDLKTIIKNELSQKLEYPPDNDQWKMILSEKQNTYVIAGAGSGKSTSLINRIIVLDHYLKRDLNTLSVFTFTKESEKD